MPHINALQYSSSLFLVSFLFFVANIKKNATPGPSGLGAIIFANYILSQLFWQDAIKGSLIHKVDGAMAKVSFCYFFIYTSFYKSNTTSHHHHHHFSPPPPPQYFIIVSLLAITFYFSDCYSKKQWLSPQHIRAHSMFHLLSFFATLYAFV
jgi:hypothetical protein